MAIRTGTTVTWAWGRARAEGKVVAIHRDTIERTLEGSRITKHGSRDDPAYEIEQADGTPVLKLRSEVEPKG
jgi:hypothetical protein